MPLWKKEAIPQALADKALPPDQHLVDSAYVDQQPGAVRY